MSSYLKCIDPHACIGCGRCVFAAARAVHNSYSIAHSPIRVSRLIHEKNVFMVRIDEAERDKITDVAQVCPRGCFEVYREGGDD